MQFNPKAGLLLLLLWAFAPDTASAQGKVRNREDSDAAPQARRKNINLHEHPFPPRLLSPDEGLSVAGAALESHVRHHPDPDCSHLVHAIYAPYWRERGRRRFYRYVKGSTTERSSKPE